MGVNSTASCALFTSPTCEGGHVIEGLSPLQMLMKNQPLPFLSYLVLRNDNNQTGIGEGFS